MATQKQIFNAFKNALGTGNYTLPGLIQTIQNYLNALENATGGDGGGVNYSTDEQKTGIKWIDGKDIYQKSFTVTADATVSTGTTSETVAGFTSDFVAMASGIDTFINATTFNNHNSTSYDCNDHIRINTSTGKIEVFDNPTVGFIGYHVYKDTVITIQYTKK